LGRTLRINPEKVSRMFPDSFVVIPSPSTSLRTGSAEEWSEPGGRDIDHTTRGAWVRERAAIESKLSELRSDPDCSESIAQFEHTGLK
jgi:hypothetical protein